MTRNEPLPPIEPDEFEQLQVHIAKMLETIMLHRRSTHAFHKAWDAAGGKGAASLHSPTSRLAHAALEMREDAVKIAVELAVTAVVRMVESEDEPECAKGAEDEPPDAA